MHNKMIRFLTQSIIVSQLFFLPITDATFGMNSFFKLFVFGFLVLVLLIFYFLRLIHKNELTINRSGIVTTSVLFLVIIFLSALFGADKPLSFFGGSVDIGYSFVYFFFLLIFFYVVITHYQTKNNISFLFRAILYTYTALLLVCYITFFSYLLNLSFTPFLENALRLSIGSFTDLAMYVSIVSVFIFAVSINNVGAKLLFPNHDAIKFLRLLLFFSMIILILVNFLPAWICIFFGMSFVLFFYKVINKASGWEVVASNEIYKKMFYVFLAVFFLILNFSNISNQIFARQLTKNLKLDYGASLSIVSEAIQDKPLLGHGGENFPYVFSKYRSENMNTNIFWNMRYRRSISYALEMLSSFGFIGFFAFLSLVLLLGRGIFITMKHTVESYKKGGNISQIGILLGVNATIISLVIAHFIYSANMLLIFLFFLFIAFLFVYNKSLGITNRVLNNFEVISRKENPKIFMFFIAKALLLIIVLTVFTVYNFKTVLVYIYHDSLTLSETKLVKITTINSYVYSYELELAEYYRDQIIEEVLITAERIDAEKINFYYKKLEILTTRLSEKKASSVSVQEGIARIYQDLESYIPGTYRLSINYYLLAIELEPSNPVLLHQVALAYLSGADKENAELYLRRAIEKKSDYSEAKFNLAKLLGVKDSVNESIELLNNLVNEQYNSVEVYYHLGRAYFSNNDFDSAIRSLEKVLLINPNHSNALYSIALSYERLGNTRSAKHYFKKVSELNPENLEVEEKLKILK